jgi:purine-nucleoside phosphorylase
MSGAHSQSTAQATEFARAERAAKSILARTKLRPRVAVVLGSGLGGFAERLAGATRIPYANISGFPHPAAAGHAGRLVIGTLDNVAIAVMQGRAHLYESYSARELGFPLRVLGRLGTRAVILTNAAGAIHPDFRTGSLVLIRDHINLMGENPLTGANDERFGPRFPDMSHAYSEAYRKIARAAARRLGIGLDEGVYAAFRGPSYETPAEIGYLRAIGADLVGMSTVPEAIVARHMGIGVLGISSVANAAADMQDRGIDHVEVLATGALMEQRLAALLRAVIPRMAAEQK